MKTVKCENCGYVDTIDNKNTSQKFYKHSKAIENGNFVKQKIYWLCRECHYKEEYA